MNVAELIGELESAIDEAQKAGKKVQTAILALRDIFGSTSLIPSSKSAMTEPDEPRPVPEPRFIQLPPKMIPCPYCGKEFPEWIRPHKKGAPRFNRNFRIARHVGMQRKLAARGFPVKVDHGQLKAPVPK